MVTNEMLELITEETLPSKEEIQYFFENKDEVVLGKQEFEENLIESMKEIFADDIPCRGVEIIIQDNPHFWKYLELYGECDNTIQRLIKSCHYTVNFKSYSTSYTYSSGRNGKVIITW